MGEVIELAPGGAARASGGHLDEPATVIVLHVAEIERRKADPWQGLPSDSAPSYVAPDTDPA